MNRFELDQIPVNEELWNPVMDVIANHASVREFDASRPLPDGVLEMLIGAAQSAPTSSNFQSWSAVAITDPERKKKMQKLCADQEFIGEAPLFIAFCADAFRHKWVTKRQGYPFNSDYLELLLVAVIDSVLACQNAALAAESMGLGCCMVGAIRNHPQEVAELLELPEMVFATVGLAVGYPSPHYEHKVKPRLPQPVVLHKERYSTEGMEKWIEEYDRKMAQTNIYVGRRVHIPGLTPEKEEDTGFYGWCEHTARRMARGNDFRRNLAEFLIKRGFSLK